MRLIDYIPVCQDPNGTMVILVQVTDGSDNILFRMVSFGAIDKDTAKRVLGEYCNAKVGRVRYTYEAVMIECYAE